MGDYGFEAVGVVDSRLQTIGVWEKPEGETNENTKPDYKRGIVYYLNKDNVLVGVLTWNIFGKVCRLVRDNLSSIAKQCTTRCCDSLLGPRTRTQSHPQAQTTAKCFAQ